MCIRDSTHTLHTEINYRPNTALSLTSKKTALASTQVQLLLGYFTILLLVHSLGPAQTEIGTQCSVGIDYLLYRNFYCNQVLTGRDTVFQRGREIHSFSGLREAGRASLEFFSMEETRSSTIKRKHSSNLLRQN